jgi:hypothetical protein
MEDHLDGNAAAKPAQSFFGWRAPKNQAMIRLNSPRNSSLAMDREAVPGNTGGNTVHDE